MKRLGTVTHTVVGEIDGIPISPGRERVLREQRVRSHPGHGHHRLMDRAATRPELGEARGFLTSG